MRGEVRKGKGKEGGGSGKGERKERVIYGTSFSPLRALGMRQLFCDIVTDRLRFPMQLSISLYLLSVLRGRLGSNVHVTGIVCL